jgi:ATP-binding cassette subfamily F protein uup
VLLSYRNLTVSFGGPKLLDNASLTIGKRERICLLGRNGEGKSTLLRIINGQIEPDKGEIEAIPGLRVGKLDQEVPADLSGTVFEVVADGLGEAARTIAEYHHLLHELGEHPDDARIADRLDTIQHELDQTDGWALEHKVENVLQRTELDGDQEFAALSGGNKRRALLARALIAEPHILLLDEPTNHLDIPGIRWLEEFLRKADIALLFVSHDRAFIQRVGNKILDLDRGQLTRWECDYDTYLQRKAEFLAGEAKQQAVFDKKLAEEEVWIRKGIQARRTRNEGRVRALKKMREERAARRNVQGKSKLDLNDAQASGRKVVTIDALHYSWGEQPLIKDFSTTIWRGDKIGIVGLNGSGKTTLLNLILKKLVPQGGSVTHGTKLEVAYFDQHRAQLDEKLSVAENVHPSGEMVTVNGKPRHILSYLQDFLFTPHTSRSPITKLSGGERARLLLARLFLQPANVLVLDEPTNDLDIETVELLEERLLEYSGTLLLVSHDRSFLDNVVTSTIALEGDGVIGEYVGGCEEWLNKQESPTGGKKPKKTPALPPHNSQLTTPNSPLSEAPRRKLTNKEREALKTLPGEIKKMEAELAALSEKMASAEYYQDPASDLTGDAQKLEALETKILEAYETLEALCEL